MTRRQMWAAVACYWLTFVGVPGVYWFVAWVKGAFA